MATTQGGPHPGSIRRKWLVIVRRWCPAAPVEIAITLVKSLIEAAESGSSGQLRFRVLLEDFRTWPGRAALLETLQKIDKLKKGDRPHGRPTPLRRPKNSGQGSPC